ncbi:MAG: protein kinase [Deltaproteobacteria bacterium]|nr:protein kinase [Deltaproteobacteria bacterium]
MTSPVTCPPLPSRYEPWPDDAQALLGSGGMADVFRARDRLLGDEVAVKVVRFEVMGTPEFKGRFEREVAASAAVVHPHVVPLHDLGVLPDGRPYLALALAESGSLLELRRTNPPWALLRRLLDETLAALACLHARGLLHLDVKLSNVLLHRDGAGWRRAWLSDLGLAKALGEREAFQGVLAGTLSYMPLELLLRRFSEIGPASDLFAMGVLIYRLMSATNPFKAGSVPAQIDMRYRPPTHVPIRPGLVVPAGLEEIVVHLLQPDPRARFDLAADLRTALAALPPVETEEPEGPDPGVDGRRDVAPPTVLVRAPEADTARRDPLAGPQDIVPTWNRPHHGRVPFRALPEPGRGARARASLPLFSLREVPLVGREVERQRLWDLARSVETTGRPQVAIVRGEAGVGKTRLVASVTRPLEESGHAIAVEITFGVRAGPQDGYAGAVRRVLRLVERDPETLKARLARWLARDRGVSPAEAASEASLLQRWALPHPGEEPVPPGVAREFLLGHLERAAWRGLGLLVVQDAHLCDTDDDGPGLAVTILRLGLPVLVVLTVRSSPVEVHPAAATALAALEALGAQILEIDRFPPAEMADLVEEILPLEAGIAREVVARSEGNPFFARELIRQWSGEHLLRLEEDESGEGPRFALTAPLDEALPPDVRTLLSSRLAALLRRVDHPVEVGRALDVVGIAGSGVPWPVLEAAAGPGLLALVEGRIVREQAGASALDHNLLERLLRERVRGRALAEAHAALAEAWARIGPPSRADLEVGRHALAAGRPQEAVAPLVRAVEWLRVAGSVAEIQSAAEALASAAGAATSGEAPLALAAIALAVADRAAGRRERAIQRLEPLLTSGLSTELAVEVAAEYVETLEYEARARLGLPALEALDPLLVDAPARARARIHQARASLLLHLGRVGPAEREALEALAEAEAEPSRVDALLLVGRCLEGSDLDAALETLDQARRRAEAAGYRSAQAEALALSARIQGARGRFEEGIEAAQEAERVALAIGYESLAPLCRNARAECLRFRGDVEAAEVLYWEGRGWAVAMGQRARTYAFDLNLALSALLRGDLPGLDGRLEAIRREADPRWERYAPAVAALEATRALLGRGRAEALRAVPLSRLLAEGLDGAFLGTVLAILARERGFHDEAAHVEQQVQASMASRGLDCARLGPMLERWQAVRGG